MKGELGVVKKMLTNGGFVKLSWAFVVLARAGKTLAVGRGTRIDDGSRNVLFNSLFQPLRRATNVPTIAVAQKLVNNIAVIMGRQHVFLNRWKELSGVENNTWFDGEKAAFHSRRNLLFELHRDVSNPWDVQVDRALFYCVNRVRIQLLKFSLESRIDYTFRVAIFQKN